MRAVPGQGSEGGRQVLQPGTSIAGYRIEREIGRGGMGTVYLARHPELPRSDALKILAGGVATDDKFRRRFLREAEVAATLDHPNVVAIYNRGRAADPGVSGDDVLWIAMQYVPGSDCAAELAGVGRFEPGRAAGIIGQVARGVDHAHRKGLLHRDIKPANILLSRTDDNTGADEQRVLLTDFGVAKPADEVDDLTIAGSVLATVAYASPEQLCGDPLTVATDQYSLAATAFHLIAGRPPFEARETAVVISQHLSAPVPRLSSAAPGVSPAADAVIARAMAKDPRQRFPNCREFADALDTALRSGPRSPHVSGPHGVSGPPQVSGPQFVSGPRYARGPQVPTPVAATPLVPNPNIPSPQPPSAGASNPSSASGEGGQTSAVLIAALIGLLAVGLIIVVLLVAALNA